MEKQELEGDFVLDTSVVIKWFSNEEGTSIALALRDSYVKGRVDIACPDLVIYEIANALRYNNLLKERDVKDALNSLTSLGINIIVPTKVVIESAISIAFMYDITIYDAYFIALAEELNFEYVTADEKLYDKTKKLDFIKILKSFKR